jgi:hypothetical protein
MALGSLGGKENDDAFGRQSAVAEAIWGTSLVIPAKAGIQLFGAESNFKGWIPAFAGMTSK